MKKILVLCLLFLCAFLGAQDNVVNVDIQNTDLFDTNMMIGGGIGWASGDPELLANFMIPTFAVPAFTCSYSKDFNKIFSYSGDLTINLLTIYSQSPAGTDKIFDFFNPGKLENYLNIHIIDEESVKVDEVTIGYNDTGFTTYITTTKLPLPIREITSIRIGKELNYDFASGLNLNIVRGLSIGYDKTSYRRADLMTDKFGEVKIRQYDKFAIDLYMTGSLDTSNVMTMVGIKAEMATILYNQFQTRMFGEIHFAENSFGDTTLCYSFYYTFGIPLSF